VASFELMPSTPVEGICPTCKQRTAFHYLGIQEDEHEQPSMTLWNCGACGSTIAGRHILPASLEALIIALAPHPHVGMTP
jgi:ribosomal protein L37AE/L43A